METTQIHNGANLYYFTFTSIHWLPVFVSGEACQILTNSLNFCHENKSLRINAYVIMPTHCHLILFDDDFDPGRLQQTVNQMRTHTGRELIRYCEEKMPAVFGQLINSAPRSDRQSQFWQQSKHPTGIRSRKFWLTKFNYLHDNPRRKGLVREAVDWRFSSAAYWLTDGNISNDVRLTGLEW